MGESCAKREKSPTTWKIENCPYTYNILEAPFGNYLKKYFCEISKFGCQTPLLECYR